MIAFVQPFGLGEGTGGARILRAMLEDPPSPVLSVCTSPAPPREQSICRELHLPLRPYCGRLESTRFARYLTLLNYLRKRRFMNGLRAIFRDNDVTAVHAIPHGMHFWYTFLVAREMGLPYYINIHDDMRYNLLNDPLLESAMKRLAVVWDQADHRFVISEQMGNEYQRRYGNHPWDVVTDGLDASSLLPPRLPAPGRLNLYFMGALHLTYETNFRAIFAALENYTERDVTFISRGSSLQRLAHEVHVENRPFAPESAILSDFGEVDLLYLPLPFGDRYEAFTRFSLSTKMVSYLGAGVPILYHGPRNAAAAEILAEYDAAVIVDALAPEALISGIETALAASERLTANARRLGKERFWLADNRERFWKVLAGGSGTSAAAA